MQTDIAFELNGAGKEITGGNNHFAPSLLVTFLDGLIDSRVAVVFDSFLSAKIPDIELPVGKFRFLNAL